MQVGMFNPAILAGSATPDLARLGPNAVALPVEVETSYQAVTASFESIVTQQQRDLKNLCVGQASEEWLAAAVSVQSFRMRTSSTFGAVFGAVVDR